MSKPYGKPLDITRWLQKDVKNRVYRVGIELEGGWSKRPAGLAHDGSVRLPNIPYPGELPSPPISPKEVPDWMRANYPDAVNETCGLHVHQSFENALHYQQLMRPDFPPTALACLADWARQNKVPKSHCLWERLAGKSVFCQHVYAADEQAIVVQKDFNREREGNRYSAIGYPYNRLGTIEYRVLPMMPTLELSIAAVLETIRITNAFLLATSRREQKHLAGVIEEGPMREIFNLSA